MAERLQEYLEGAAEMWRSAKRAARRILGMMVLALRAPAAARGQTISYVAPGGSDTSGTGSPSAPWATISTALAHVADGSTIVVREGTDHGRVRLDRRFATGVVVRSETPYRARLRNHGTVVTCYSARGSR